MKYRVDNAARSFFHQNDSFIKQFCTKWIQVKECFRPLFGGYKMGEPKIGSLITKPLFRQIKYHHRCGGGDSECQISGTEGADLQLRQAPSTEPPVPVVYFDKNYIGNVSSETILTTIEFLESFLPPPTKKHKRKNRVRGRLDDMDIE